jgi:predicted Fe-Mo cluster-binding NifX family protein
MKIAISATGPGLDADIDPRFGRCRSFIIVDPETLEFEAIENSGIAASGGAGTASAQMVASRGVEAVLTGNCGPNAYQVLEAAGVRVYTGVSGKVSKAIEDYKSGKYQPSPQANVESKSGVAEGPGMGRGMGMGMGRGIGMGRGRGGGMGRGRFLQ